MLDPNYHYPEPSRPPNIIRVIGLLMLIGIGAFFLFLHWM